MDVGRLIGWLSGRPTDERTGSLVHWLTIWQIGWRLQDVHCLENWKHEWNRISPTTTSLTRSHLLLLLSVCPSVCLSAEQHQSRCCSITYFTRHTTNLRTDGWLVGWSAITRGNLRNKSNGWCPAAKSGSPHTYEHIIFAYPIYGGYDEGQTTNGIYM